MESWTVLELISKGSGSCKTRAQDIKAFYPNSWAIPYDPKKKKEAQVLFSEKDWLSLFRFFPSCTHLAICTEGLICIDVNEGDIELETLDKITVPFTTETYRGDYLLEDDPVIPLSFLSQLELRLSLQMGIMGVESVGLTSNKEKKSVSEILASLWSNISSLKAAASKEDIFPKDFLRREREVFFTPLKSHSMVPLDKFYDTISARKSASNEFFLIRGPYQIGGGTSVLTPDAYGKIDPKSKNQILTSKGFSFKIVEGENFAKGMIVSALLSGRNGDERLKGVAWVNKKWYSVIDESSTKKAVSTIQASRSSIGKNQKLQKLMNGFIEMGMRVSGDPEFAVLPDGRFQLIDLSGSIFSATLGGGAEPESLNMTISSPTQGEGSDKEPDYGGMAPPIEIYRHLYKPRPKEKEMKVTSNFRMKLEAEERARKASEK